MHMQVCTCSHTSICLWLLKSWDCTIYGRAQLCLEEINPVSCKGTRFESHNTTLNWATGSTQQRAQREGRVNKNIFAPAQINIPSQFEKQTIPSNYISAREQWRKKKVKRDLTFFFLNRHYDNELQLWGDTLHPGSLAIFLQSNEFGQSSKHLDYSIPTTITLTK